MLLGAAKYLAEIRNFPGRAAVIFQPAEEDGGGGNEMVKDGLRERFAIEEIYGMHNMPGIPIGHFGSGVRPIMASTDEFTITVNGRGGHAAKQHRTIDPIVNGAQMINALQTIASRNVDPLASVVISVTQFTAFTHNVIPEHAVLAGTVRTIAPGVHEICERRIREMVEGVASAHSASVDILYDCSYPVTCNHAEETAHSIAVAKIVAGEQRVNASLDPIVAGEDFSYMLLARPGAFVFVATVILLISIIQPLILTMTQSRMEFPTG